MGHPRSQHFVLASLEIESVERVTGNRGRGQENQNIKLSVWTTAKNSTVLGVSEHAESIG